MIVFIAGEHGSGKTELACWLQANHNFAVIDLGPALRSHWQKDRPQVSFAEYIALEEAEVGKNFTDRLLSGEVQRAFECLRENGCCGLLVVGSRSLAGLLYLRDGLEQHGVDSKIIWLEAEESTLKQRCCNREGKDLTQKEFLEILEKDRERGVCEIKSRADFTIVNEGSKADMYETAARLLGLGHT